MRERQLSWEEAIVEGSLEWSFLTREDLPEVAELCAAIEYFDDPAQRRELAGLIEDFDRPWAYASNHAVAGRDRGGTIVAYGWNHVTDPEDPLPHAWMEIGVHPAWRHHKIGVKRPGTSLVPASTRDSSGTWAAVGGLRSRRRLSGGRRSGRERSLSTSTVVLRRQP